MTASPGPGLYDDRHALLQQLAGRDSDNPLGDVPFDLLRRLLGGRPTLRVLDVGCGRGRACCRWAAEVGARVDGLDLSDAMLAEARQAVAAARVEDRVSLRQQSFESLRHAPDHDLVLAHDILCYAEDAAATAAGLLGALRPGGFASVSSYFAELPSDGSFEVAQAWGIRPPLPLVHYRRLLDQPGYSCVLFLDTTGHYRRHWSTVRETLEARRADAVDRVGEQAVEAFAERVRSIQRATRDGLFGHWWAVVERAP